MSEIGARLSGSRGVSVKRSYKEGGYGRMLGVQESECLFLAGEVCFGL